jgi:membrane-associated phospholipid phosphatase
MHVSVATLTALHLEAYCPRTGPWIFIFPMLIAISAIFTKQHYFLDLAPGALLGWMVFKVFLILLAT